MLTLKDLLALRSGELVNCIVDLKTNSDLLDNIEKAANMILKGLENNQHIYFFGNGGSAADAQHLAAEFVGRFKMERNAMPATALTVNTSVLTALANDYDFSIIFSRQVESCVRNGDICIGLSTSGNSQNVLFGLKAAKSKDAKTIAILGKNGNAIKEEADISICLPSDDTPRIQEMTILIGHIICEYVESCYNKAK